MSKEKSKFNFSKCFNAFICALLLSIFLSILLAYSFTKIAGWGFLIGLISFTYWFYKSDSKKRAWARTFIGLSIESFALPIVMFIFSVAFVATQTKGVAEGVGGAIGGMLVVIISAVIGLFLGVIFLIAGIFTFKSIKKEIRTTGSVTKEGKLNLNSKEK
jgi:hypothetical protein